MIITITWSNVIGRSVILSFSEQVITHDRGNGVGKG